MSTSDTRTVNVFGDVLSIRWDGNVWVSPCNGQQHAHARDAMRAELERYYTDCGQDIEDESIAEAIDGYLDQMSSGD